jgi:hypothetical protein
MITASRKVCRRWLVAHVRLNRSVPQVRAALFRANLGLPSAFIEIVDSPFGTRSKINLCFTAG